MSLDSYVGESDDSRLKELETLREAARWRSAEEAPPFQGGFLRLMTCYGPDREVRIDGWAPTHFDRCARSGEIHGWKPVPDGPAPK